MKPNEITVELSPQTKELIEASVNNVVIQASIAIEQIIRASAERIAHDIEVSNPDKYNSPPPRARAS